jgi:predicted nucleotidyltransferase
MLAETRRLLAEHPAVSAAFVFGSWAQEGARAGRDVDVALLPDGRLSHAAAFSLALEAGERLEHALGGKVDVVLLPHAAPGVAFRALEENGFVVLGRAGIIDAALAERLKGLVRFRNILVHDYLSVDPGLVYDHLSQRIEDFGAFARQVAAYVEPEAGSGGRD